LPSIGNVEPPLLPLLPASGELVPPDPPLPPLLPPPPLLDEPPDPPPDEPLLPVLLRPPLQALPLPDVPAVPPSLPPQVPAVPVVHVAGFLLLPPQPATTIASDANIIDTNHACLRILDLASCATRATTCVSCIRVDRSEQWSRLKLTGARETPNSRVQTTRR